MPILRLNYESDKFLDKFSYLKNFTDNKFTKTTFSYHKTKLPIFNF